LSKSASRARLAEIIRKRSFGRGEITLASGRKSDFYFNLKPTMLDPEGAALLAELTFEALKDDNLDFVGGLEMGAVPLAGAIAQLPGSRGTRSPRSSCARSRRSTAPASQWRGWPRERPCRASAS
jgi:orotate phosphoribosyltransferase